MTAASPSPVLPARKPGAPAPPRSLPFPSVLGVIVILITLGNLPLWVLQYIVSRPPEFTGILGFLFAKFFKTMRTVYAGLPPPEEHGEAARPPKIGMNTKRFPWNAVTLTVVAVQPVPAEWRKAYAADVEGVHAVERPGFMISPPGALGQGAALAKEGEKVIMFIHGGAYIAGHPLMRPMPANLALDTSLRVFGLQYRKCLDDASAFPGPLLDALAGWRYLTVTLGFEPSNIVVAGVSAGGNLANGLVMQLGALGMPLPGGLALSSPWSDFTMSFPSWERNDLDLLSRPGLARAVRSCCRHYDVAAIALPFFSPSLAEEGTWRFMAGVPVFISVGGAEAFEDEIEAYAHSLRVDGVDVTLCKEPHGLHAAPTVPLQPPEAYEHFRDGLQDVLKQVDIKAGGDGGN